MVPLPSRRRLAQVALPTMLCAALVAGATRARSASPADEAVPLTLVQADTRQGGAAPAPPAAGQTGAPAGHSDMQGGDMHHGWGGMRDLARREAWAARRQLRLADRLATMRVYLDITPQQEDAWHAFTQAVLAMVPDPKAMGDGMHDSQDTMGAFDGIDRMAKMLQRRADAAQAVDQAAQKLKSVLSGAQIEKADAAWTAMREAWMRRRWHHHHGWHHDDDDDGMKDR